MLDDYIIPGDKGPVLLVLQPAGLPSLAEHVASCRAPRTAPHSLATWESVRLAQRNRLQEAARQAGILLRLDYCDGLILADLLAEAIDDVAALTAEWS